MMKNILAGLKFKRELIEQVKKTKLSLFQKQLVITQILWRPDVVEQFKSALKEGHHQLQDEGVVGFGEIDWENFDWEAAAEFWVKVIEAVAKIILAVI